MRLNELLDVRIEEDLRNHRVSHLVVVTFDLHGVDPNAYPPLEQALADELDLGRTIWAALDSRRRYNREMDLPHNTFATLYQKTGSAVDQSTYFTRKIEKILKDQKLDARFFVAVGENWSVGGGKVGKRRK